MATVPYIRRYTESTETIGGASAELAYLIFNIKNRSDDEDYDILYTENLHPRFQPLDVTQDGSQSMEV